MLELSAAGLIILSVNDNIIFFQYIYVFFVILIRRKESFIYNIFFFNKRYIVINRILLHVIGVHPIPQIVALKYGFFEKKLDCIQALIEFFLSLSIL